MCDPQALDDQANYLVSRAVSTAMELNILGCWHLPGARHDGSPWHKGESKRAAQAGKPCPKAVLVQVRGDWSFHKSALHLPAWSLGWH